MKQTFVIASSILILISLNACKKEVNDLKENLIEQTEIAVEEKFYFDCKKQFVNGIEYEACITRPGIFRVKNSNGKIIYIHEDNPFDFVFSDFNGDGYSDILMNYVSNTPGIQELLLFDVNTNKFEFVEFFNSYPNSKRINESNFYYSYHSNGCADNDWGSELYKLNETKIVPLGRIKGLGCLENDENGIYIYKLNGENEELLNYIKREEGYWSGKFDFIEQYWRENKEVFK